MPGIPVGARPDAAWLCARLTLRKQNNRREHSFSCSLCLATDGAGGKQYMDSLSPGRRCFSKALHALSRHLPWDFYARDKPALWKYMPANKMIKEMCEIFSRLRSAAWGTWLFSSSSALLFISSPMQKNVSYLDFEVIVNWNLFKSS